jgi:hypothetical protein
MIEDDQPAPVVGPSTAAHAAGRAVGSGANILGGQNEVSEKD